MPTETWAIAEPLYAAAATAAIANALDNLFISFFRGLLVDPSGNRSENLK
jgi:hypothetical protein